MVNYKKTLKNYLADLNNRVSPHNAKLIKDYIEKLKATPNEPGDYRLYTVLCRITSIEKILKKPLDELKEKDLIKLNTEMKNKGMISAKYYRRVLKNFLTLSNKKKNIDVIDSDFLKSPRKKNGSQKLVNPHLFWSQEQIAEYVKEAKRHSVRQTAWAALWLSIGARPHELLSLRKKNIKFEEVV